MRLGLGAMVGLGANGYEVRDFLYLPSSGAGFLLKCLWHRDGKIVLMLSHQKKPTDRFSQGSRLSQHHKGKVVFHIPPLSKHSFALVKLRDIIV